MKKSAALLLGIFLFILTSPLTALAVTASGDLQLLPDSLHLSTQNPTEGRTVRMYATVKNNDSEDLYGTVKFFDTSVGKQIGGDQPVSVFAGKTDDVFVDWTPESGEHEIKVRIMPWQGGDNMNNNIYTIIIHVEPDADHDSVPDSLDTDMDNDGVPNAEDAFPRDGKESKDTDGDAIGDNADSDRDNDGVPNAEDAFPLDPKESKDTDHDSIGDVTDNDIDGDGIPNNEEVKLGTSPLSPDTDKDGTTDKKDAFPLDPKESKDTDHNGVGNSKDPDIDGDKIPNAQDPFPENVAPTVAIESSSKPLVAKVGESFTLDASPSFDSDGKIEKISWLVDGHKKYEGIRPSISFDEPGIHEVQLQVTDNKGETKTKSWNIYGATSVLLTQGGVVSAIIALALLALFYYITKASRANSKQNREKESRENRS